jgi:Zn-dependent M28 family amino/carboxypeptidase
VATGYLEGFDYLLVNYTAPGDVTAPVSAVDLQLGLGNTSTSGCDAADFVGFPAGRIALIQRGACSFQLKAENAAAAGAVGVILFTQGDADGRFDAIESTLSPGYIGGIPVLFTSYYNGEAWADTPGLAMHMVADVFLGERTTYNLLAETPSGNPDNVVMVGASLDSVSNGPGIQSNGAGSAAILEVALQMAKVKPRNKVRFAWWGAEESGILGSFHYVDSLTPEELESIALYLNFDTIASPNHVYFIYDGDDSDGFGTGPGAEGSAQIEKLFEGYYTMVGKPFKGIGLFLPSDYYPFNLAGIPVGGLYTGDIGIKTPEEAALWGGTAGEQYDPCYHLACDTFDNISLEALDVNSDAVAYAVLQYAMSTEDINGVKGKGNFRLDDVFVEAVR